MTESVGGDRSLLRVGIDGSNLLRGGGRTHLIELLRAAKPEESGIGTVVLWGMRSTLDLIDDQPWLVKKVEPMIERDGVFRFLWQYFRFAAAARKEGCDAVFVPGGSFMGRFSPAIVMCRNMLPFEWGELKRFGPSLMSAKLLLLRLLQTLSFRRAEGVVFLTEYARAQVSRVCGTMSGSVAVIPHGVSTRFSDCGHLRISSRGGAHDGPLRFLYVSIIDVYKHQWNVVQAVAMLRRRGVAAELALVGPYSGAALMKLKESMARFDPGGDWVRYEGELRFTELHNRYSSADVGIFASSCENMPNILLEMMSGGLPVACSSRGPMPEVLGEAGVYFDPEEPTSICDALEWLVADPLRMSRASADNFQAARKFSWERCSTDTFDFISRVAREYKGA